MQEHGIFDELMKIFNLVENTFTIGFSCIPFRLKVMSLILSLGYAVDISSPKSKKSVTSDGLSLFIIQYLIKVYDHNIKVIVKNFYFLVTKKKKG